MTTNITINETANYKKRQCNELAEHLRHMGLEKEALSLKNCSSCITYALFEDFKKVSDIRMCQKRYCPICGDMQRSQHSHKMSTIVDTLTRYNSNLITISLELTLRNNSVDHIRKDIKTLKTAWSKIVKCKAIKPNIIGYVYYIHPKYTNQDEYNEMNTHNHMHVIIFFKEVVEEHLKVEYWTEIFKRTANLPYTPYVHLRMLENKEAIITKANYAAKPLEIKHISKKDIKVYLEQIKKQRLITMSQSLNKIYKPLAIKKFTELTSEYKGRVTQYWDQDHYQLTEF